MPNNVKRKSTALDLKAMTKLFGPAPVLTSEVLKDYDTVLKQLMDCIEPCDFIEQMFVTDVAVASWDIKRFNLYKTLLIEQEHERHQEKEQERRKRSCEIRAAIAERAEAAKQVEPAGEPMQAEQAGTAPTQVERMLELEAVWDGTVEAVDDTFPADETDHAKALQSGIAYFEKLDRLLTVAMARRDDALAQIDFYRQGLGERLRRASVEIIDGEFRETAPSIVGPADGAQ